MTLRCLQGSLKCEDGLKAFADPPEVIMTETLVYAGLIDRKSQPWGDLELTKDETPKVYTICPVSYNYVGT